MHSDGFRQRTAEAWLSQIFSAKAVARGGVIRRASRWVECEIGRDRFIAEVQARGFHMIECGGQLVVICNSGGIRVIC
ncbi:N-(5'-phosphoribosyl)anthranilate isomerase [Tropicimonas sediminicola]|uniref:N-(5'-phosphoribosyl)anthranilate isomerase n=1 Tax=Tropicimonas sediminicola TaxID=1031541 RepID=A0A239EM44_9RHOB|nr:N-(5'-phosphoribosyl)anthranilate isomerase [Tropicimonas sediminicola]SNS45735.1 hypothetical protein SAMN05421757_102228 [Tropicimonas sediminicola]